MQHFLKFTGTTLNNSKSKNISPHPKKSSLMDSSGILSELFDGSI